MPSKSDYEKTLDKLSKLLRRKPLTAKQIAAALACCKPVAYQRVKALQARGERVHIKRVREGNTGPESAQYAIDGTG